MAETFVVLTTSPLTERANLICVLGSSAEPSRLMRIISQSFNITSSNSIHTLYSSPPNLQNTTLLHTELDIALNYKAYEEFFRNIIDTFANHYGPSLLFALPECDNLQSIAKGLLNVYHAQLDRNLILKLYVEPESFGIVKPIADNILFSLKKRQEIKNFLFSSLNCSECQKFCYIPLVKACCGRFICARCGYRDKKVCMACNASIENLRICEEFKEICGNAPYVCKCGVVTEFNKCSAHIQTCHMSEVECRVCGEMTKYSNFAAHMRMCHMDILKRDALNIT